MVWLPAMALSHASHFWSVGVGGAAVEGPLMRTKVSANSFLVGHKLFVLVRLGGQ
jgi:hypothetical protein